MGKIGLEFSLTNKPGKGLVNYKPVKKSVEEKLSGMSTEQP